MSLKRALESLPSDRETEAGLRDILRFASAHPDEWLGADRLVAKSTLSLRDAGQVLSGLARWFVLDFHDDPPRYRYRRDRVLELEVRAFLRRADSHTGMLQSSVERFRSRYGAR